MIEVFDVIIFVAIALILIILVRKMPDEKTSSLQVQSGKKTGKWSLKLPSIKFDFRLPRFSKTKNIDPLESADSPIKEASGFQLDSKEINKIKLRQADELLSEGKTDRAEKIYVELAVQAPDDPRIFNRLGAVYLKQKNYADARDSFLQALRIDDTKASRHYNLGMAYVGMGAREKARVSLKKAVEIEPGKEKYKKALQKLDGGG